MMMAWTIHVGKAANHKLVICTCYIGCAYFQDLDLKFVVVSNCISHFVCAIGVLVVLMLRICNWAIGYVIAAIHILSAQLECWLSHVQNLTLDNWICNSNQSSFQHALGMVLALMIRFPI